MSFENMLWKGACLRQFDFDEVLPLAGVRGRIRVRAMANGGDIGDGADDALREKKTESEGQVLSGRAHRHCKFPLLPTMLGRISKLDTQGLLACNEICCMGGATSGDIPNRCADDGWIHGNGAILRRLFEVDEVKARMSVGWFCSGKKRGA
jgi:hypothetical protein